MLFMRPLATEHSLAKVNDEVVSWHSWPEQRLFTLCKFGYEILSINNQTIINNCNRLAYRRHFPCCWWHSTWVEHKLCKFNNKCLEICILITCHYTWMVKWVSIMLDCFILDYLSPLTISYSFSTSISDTLFIIYYLAYPRIPIRFR